MRNISNFNKKQFLTIFNRKQQSIYNENPILTLLKGPDTRYEKILMNENEEINNQCQEKNSFLQIYVRK